MKIRYGTPAQADIHANAGSSHIRDAALVGLNACQRTEILRNGTAAQRPDQGDANEDPAHGLKFSRDRLPGSLYHKG